MGDGHYQTEDNGQESADGQKGVGDEDDQHELPHTLLGGARWLHAIGAYRERAAEEGEGKAEKQGELHYLLQLCDLQVLNIGDNEEGEEDDTVYRMGALGNSQAGARKQLQQRQAGRQRDQHGQRFECGRLFQFQIVILEERLQFLAVELVLTGDAVQEGYRGTLSDSSHCRGHSSGGAATTACSRRRWRRRRLRRQRRAGCGGAAATAAAAAAAATFLLPRLFALLDFLKRHFFHVRAIHKPRRGKAPPLLRPLSLPSHSSGKKPGEEGREGGGGCCFFENAGKQYWGWRAGAVLDTESQPKREQQSPKAAHPLSRRHTQQQPPERSSFPMASERLSVAQSHSH